MTAHDDIAAVLALLPENHSWPDRPQADDLANLPNTPAVFLLTDAQQRPVQLLTTRQLKRLAASRLLAASRQRSTRADLAAIVRHLHWRSVHSPFEARWYYYRLARLLYPDDYRKRIGFGPAWFLHVDFACRPAAQIDISERIWTRAGSFLGPWPTQRAARDACQTLIDLFELCREPEQLRRVPHGRRCSYADMGRCDAPCDGSVPTSAYAERVARAWRFAAGECEPLIVELEQRMRRAARELRFEQAAVLKQQLEQARQWQRRWAGRVVSAEQMAWLLVVPAARRKAVKPFVFRCGELREGPLIQHRRLPGELTRWAADTLSAPPGELDAVVRMEQTWLVAHFIEHRDSEGALVLRLEGGKLPAGLAGRLAEKWPTGRGAGPADDRASQSASP